MKAKFILSVSLAAVWLGVSAHFAVRWARAVSQFLPAPYVWWVIIGIALLPGFLMSAMLLSNLMHLRLSRYPHTCEDVTVLICARNEENCIARAVRSVLAQRYAGRIRVIVLDNASTDATARRAMRAAARAPRSRSVEVVYCAKPGKARALNTGLELVRTAHFLTLDADTVLDPNAVQRIMDHIVARKSACTAGNLFVGNTRASLIAAMQTYDYLLSIAAVKRYQGSYRSTLVAQGAFSAYCTRAVREAGGWPDDALGEDIVLTYRLLERGWASTYEPRAAAYTDVPETLHGFFRQRGRWAFGMLEGLAAVPPWRQGSFFACWFESVNPLVIVLDLAYLTGFVPGVVLALHGICWFVGVLTLVMLAVNLLIYATMYAYQRSLGIPFRNSLAGFVCFLLFFQFFQSAAALSGYAAWLCRRRNW